MRTPPGGTITHHSVEDGEQLPHARHQSHLLRLASGQEALVERSDDGVAATGDQRSHLERFSDPLSTAPYAPRALMMPESQLRGATPTKAESSMGVREPSSGSSARSVRHSTGSTPGPDLLQEERSEAVLHSP